MATDLHVDEQVVVQIWERQSLDLSALSRLGMIIVFRGVPSDAGGPDYQDAVLSVGERHVISGDVEFHVRTSDWYRHGHHRDAHYNRVVLHVVWRDDLGVTECASGELVPVLEVGTGDAGEAGVATARDVLIPHPCVARFAALSTDELRRRIRALGKLRFEERSDAFSADMTERSADQVLYAALLEALGYASNRSVFRELADAAPYWWLATVPHDEREAVLLDAAGLGPASRLPPPVRLRTDSWRLVRVRPGNHPIVRLRGIAGLLARTGPNLADEIATIVTGSEKPADLRRALMVGDGSGSLVGAGRADELAVSVVLPFVSAYGITESALKLFELYPSPPANRWTRLTVTMFTDGGHKFKPRLAVEHQGVHHLYHRNCRYERRGGCGVCGVPG